MSKKKVALAAGLAGVGIVGVSLSVLIFKLAKIVYDLEDFDDLQYSDF